MAKTALVAAGVLLLAGGAGLAGYGATRKATGGMTPEASSAMTAAIGQLDGDIRAAQAALKGEAESIAAIPQAQAAVSSNLDTVKNLIDTGEWQIQAKPGEVVELGQVFKDKPADPVVLFQAPTGSMRSVHAGKVGPYVEVMGDKALVTFVTGITPKDRASELTGYVMVSRPLDLGPAFAKLDAAHVSGALEIDGKSHSLGTPVAGAESKEMALPSVPNAKITVQSQPLTGGPQMPLIAGGGGVAGLGLILLIIGLVTGKKTLQPNTTMPGMQPANALSQFGTAQTQISSASVGHMGAQGTPSPVTGPLPSASISSANLGPGSMIGRWEIIKRIGSGGMADVYLSRARGEAGFEKLVAVKVMHPHLARNERAVEHFLDEARLASRIDHPNVVQIQDLGKIGADYIIVMEYVDGVDLEKLLASARAAQRPVPIEVALGILMRVCDGLNAAHNSITVDGQPMNLVHRDVKSANVLVSKQGGVKVVDFGIAKAASQAHLTVAGETKGTPSMMAPEQRVGEVVDVRADVYSVGAVAFEIVTGHGVNLDLAALAHLGVDNWPHLPLPSTLRAGLPIELDALLMSCMSFDKERRPANCAVLEASFDNIMKKYGLNASDKDIARWVSTEAAALVPSSAETSHAPRV